MGFDYWYGKKTTKDGNVKGGTACFATLSGGNHSHVIYDAKYHNLSDEQIDFYVELIYKMLGKIKISHIKTDKVVTWTVKVAGMNYGKQLCYLTSMRMGEEFPKTVALTFDTVKEKGIFRWNQIFAIFQENSANFGCAGHGIICKGNSYYGSGSTFKGPITLAQFRKNLVKKKKTTCNSHFVYP